MADGGWTGGDGGGRNHEDGDGVPNGLDSVLAVWLRCCLVKYQPQLVCNNSWCGRFTEGRLAVVLDDY
ncbi:hypothetical protein NL676_020985 [Syzygium grande]|nr:hypothetical protein NL676_020985 [Syzygium grande]